MSCGTLYDFIDGKTYRMPAAPRAGADAAQDGLHGVRPILNPSEDTQILLRDHMRLLTKIGAAAAP